MQVNQANQIKSSATERVFAGLGVVGMAGGAVVVRYFNPVTAGFFPQCPFHAVTGLNCPGCGMTRGFNALFQGDILTALHFNALLPFFVLFFGYLAVSLLLLAVRGRGLSWQIFRPPFLYAFFVITLVFAVARNLPFYPFSLLAI